MPETRSSSKDEMGESEVNKETSMKCYEPNASSNESTNTMLNEIINIINARFEKLDAKLDTKLDTNFEDNDSLMNAMNNEIETMHSKYDTKFEKNTSLMNTKFEENASLLEKKMNRKCEENTVFFESKLQQLLVNQTAESRHHTKHIADQHDALIDDIKVTMDDLRDDICIVQSDHDKKLKNINLKSVSNNS